MTESGDRIATKDTREIIMEATYRALSKHGYKNLRMRDIGEEMEMTRQVIHYHFDGKHDLLSAFLEYVTDQYEGSVEVAHDAGPREELDARIDQCIFGPDFEEFTHWDRMKVYHEIFAHARHDDAHQELFAAHYEQIRGSIVEVVEEGIAVGVFHEVDPNRFGGLVTDAIHMARERKLSLGQEDAPSEVRRSIDDYMLTPLYREPVDSTT